MRSFLLSACLVLTACAAETATDADLLADDSELALGKADGFDDSDEPGVDVASPEAAAPRSYDECESSTCYWMVLYSSQLGRNPGFLRAGYSHTFAQFVAVENGDTVPSEVEAAEGQANPIEINWMPEEAHRRSYVRIVRRHQTGVNWPVLDTLRASGELGRQVSMWGPIRVTEDLYRSAAHMRESLDGGEIGYDAIHRGSERELPNGGGRTLNCFQAVVDIDFENRGTLLRTGSSHGEEATRLVAFFFKQYMIGPRQYGEEEANIARLLGLYDIATPITPRTAELDGRMWLRVYDAR